MRCLSNLEPPLIMVRKKLAMALAALFLVMVADPNAALKSGGYKVSWDNFSTTLSHSSCISIGFSTGSKIWVSNVAFLPSQKK